MDARANGRKAVFLDRDGTVNRNTHYLIDFEDFELLLIDDGSTDGSGALCDRYSLSDGRIKTFHIQNSGPSAARNIGIENARSGYLGFVDSDDWIDAEMYRILLNRAREAQADLVFCNYIYENPQSSVTVTTYPDKDRSFNKKDVVDVEMREIP